MNSNPNQKIILLHKAEYDDDHAYMRINKEVLFAAMSRLKPLEMKVFLYIVSNQDGYKFALSSKDIADKVRADKRKIQVAINGLIEKGVMVKSDGIFLLDEESLLRQEKV